jgi:cell division transport system permease protein
MRTFLKTSASKSASISTFIGTTMVLILVGLLLVFWILGSALTQHFQDQLVAQVRFIPDANENDLLVFKKQIEAERFCQSTTYVSSDEAAAMMKEELGDDFVAGVLGYNPLPASLDVRMNPEEADLQTIRQKVEDWKKSPLVKDVIVQESLIEKINHNIAHWSLILMTIAGLLLMISIALIVNTVELTIFSQRFIIRSMQLVGATQWFIIKPFVLKSMWQGARASLIALVIIFSCLYYMMQDWPDVISVLMEKGRVLWVVLGTLFVGLSVSTLATMFSVRKFVRLKHDELNA